MGGKNVLLASQQNEEEPTVTDTGFEEVKKNLDRERQNLWTSIEVYSYYQQNGGNILSRQGLLSKLSIEFGNELLVLSSPGIASILAFRKHAASILKVEEIDEFQADVSNISKCIRREVEQIPTNRNLYERQMPSKARC